MEEFPGQYLWKSLSFGDSNGIRTRNHLVPKRTLK